MKPRTKLQSAVRYAGICIVTGFFVGIGLAAGVSLFTAVVQRPSVEKVYYADKYSQFYGYPNWDEEGE